MTSSSSRTRREHDLLGEREVPVQLAIERACREVLEGRFDDQFVVDMIQGSQCGGEGGQRAGAREEAPEPEGS